MYARFDTRNIPKSSYEVPLAHATLSSLAPLQVTHRLSCLMTRAEEAEWMAFAGGDSATPPALEFAASSEPDSAGIIVAR